MLVQSRDLAHAFIIIKMLESTEEIPIVQNLIDQSKVSKSHLLLVSFIKILEFSKVKEFW